MSIIGLKRLSIFSYCICLIIFSMNCYGAKNIETHNDCASVSAHHLLCEMSVDPIGLDQFSPRFSWQLGGLDRAIIQRSYRVRVATNIALLQADTSDVWDSGVIINSSNREHYSWDTFYATLPSHIILQSATTYYWQVRVEAENMIGSKWSPISSFTTGLYSDKDWADASWIYYEPTDTLIMPGIHNPLIKKTLGTRKVGMYKLPQFRKVIQVRRELKQALWYVCGLGQQECFINGNKVGNGFLDPAWTQYNKDLRYISHDVTSLLKTGKNVLGVMLGNGFFNNPRERYNKLIGSYGSPRLRACLILKYADGENEYIVTNDTWRATSSPVTFSSIYGGENYDATMEEEGWMSNVNFDDSHWHSVFIEPHDTAVKMRSGYGARVSVKQRMIPVRAFKNDAGHYVYDFGQNMSGIVRVQMKGNKGETIVLRPAELLRENSIYQKPVGSPYFWQYTLGDSLGSWQPQFTYTGFRYVEVENAVPLGVDNPLGLPIIKNIEALHTTHNTYEVGSFRCSNPMLNRTHEIIDWAMRSNMVSIFTDCPHREKLGWLEQVHLMQNSLLYRYWLAPLYSKVIDDMAMAQTETGVIPTIAPEYTRFTHGFDDTPEWGSAFIISPWQHYKWYGDIEPIVQHYYSMQRYIDYLGTRANNHIVSYGLGDWYDLGPDLPGYAQLTTNGVTATAIYYYDVLLMSKMANLLGRSDDASRYENLSEQIKKAYNDTFFNKDSCYYDRNSQCANAISLYMGLVPDAYKKSVTKRLIDDIRSRDNAFTAGDVGYGYLISILTQLHRDDVIYDMNVRYDIPGYGWQLAHGATALTESWQAYERVSNNHFMLGHLMEWLYSGLAGIRQAHIAPWECDPQSVGWRKAIIDPRPVGDVTSCSASVKTLLGRYFVDWNISPQGNFQLYMEVPAGSIAEVCLPTKDIKSVYNYGQPVENLDCLQNEGVKADGKLHFTVGSGSYLWEVTSPDIHLSVSF